MPSQSWSLDSFKLTRCTVLIELTWRMISLCRKNYVQRVVRASFSRDFPNQFLGRPVELIH